MRPRRQGQTQHREPRDHRRAPPPQSQSRDFEVIYGLRACLAVLEARRGDIERFAFSRAMEHEIEPLLRFAEDEGVPFAERPDRELDRLAESEHHEGVCMLVRPRAWTTPGALADALVRARGGAIALDRVRNPYNVGAILRSAAFFGVTGAILGAPAPHPALSPQAVRVAEGGAERILLSRTTDLADTLVRLKAKGVRILGADGAATRFLERGALPRPTVVVLGNEREGLGDRVRAQCDELVAIKGAGTVESLNVAVAAGLFLEKLAPS
jgi:TrmH RNA methyltransferase